MHIIDPEKLSSFWGIEWDENMFEEYDDYLFTLEGGQVLSFNSHRKPKDIRYRTKLSGVIYFRNITKVLYAKRRQAILVESVDEEFFSQMILYQSGEFCLDVAVPVKLYKASMSEVLLRAQSDV